MAEERQDRVEFGRLWILQHWQVLPCFPKTAARIYYEDFHPGKK